ncbi:MAG TPA: agmatinase family protein [Candidatus Thermoplasmatota archaeon]|nr:agmatinase family protein [Candidatus Thermoplasmatota archaeon]
MQGSLFSSTAAAWSARPSDPNDVFLAQVVSHTDGPARVGLFGIPFDGAVLGRPGAREGPDAIRAQMAKLKPWSLSGGPSQVSVRDWGNVRCPMDVAGAHQATETAALAVLDAGQVPLALGGDHSLTFPLVKAHEGRRQKMGIINLDAHLDVRDFSGVPNSGTSFGRLLDLGLVPGANLVEVGIRDFANAHAYAQKVHKAGGTILGANEWMREGVSVIDHAIDVASEGVDGVYLSVDIDVLDQAHAPGVSAPTPGGVDTRTLLAAIDRICERCDLVGADIMETAPPLDRDHQTSRAAAFVAMKLLGGL